MNHFHSLELPLETRLTSTISHCLKITQNFSFEFFVSFLAFLTNFSKIQMAFVCKCCSMKSFLGHIFFFSSLDFS